MRGAMRRPLTFEFASVRIALGTFVLIAMMVGVMATGSGEDFAVGKLAPRPGPVAAGGPQKLECESLVTPLGMDAKEPVLSWQIRDEREGARQTAYQIQVASQESLLAAGKADVWDSGRVESDDSRNVKYAGPALRPTTRYFWQVRAWDKDGNAYLVSRPSWWETGLQDSQNWKGKWI